jgi:hypothetical protein
LALSTMAMSFFLQVLQVVSCSCVVLTKLSIVHIVDHKLIVYVNITGVHQALQNYINRAFSLLLFIA